MKKRSCFLSILAVLTAMFTSSPGYAASPLTEKIDAAEVFLSRNLGPKLLNHSTVPNWIGAGDHLWIDYRTPTGHEFRLIEAATGAQKPAFDHAVMAAALSRLSGEEVSAADLPIWSLTFKPDMTGLVAIVNGQPVTCDLPVTDCAAPPSGGGAPEGMPARSLPSPDGSRIAYLQDHNVWIRDLATGEARQVTTDGVENFSYGDVDAYMDFLKVISRRVGLPETFRNVVWSPDGTHLLALRQDLRAVSDKPLMTEYLPPEGGYGIAYSGRIGSAIEPQRPPSVLTLVDVRTGQATRVDIDPQALNDYALIHFMGGLVWWPEPGTDAYLLSANRGGSHYRLTRIALKTGKARDVIRETAKFNVRLNPSDYASPNVQVLASGEEAVWYSERDGWGHLYLYDLKTGKVKNRITKGKWVVTDLLCIDEQTRTVYFAAMGREAGRNPYYRHLYKVSLDGGEVTLLTPEDADHDFKALSGLMTNLNAAPTSSLSPDGRYIADSYSTIDQPPVMVLRDISGRLIGKVMQGDATALEQMGWTPPERVIVKAADGQTDLYGVMYKPADFDPAMAYPVINITYPGPQGRWAPVMFRENIFSSALNASALANMGFIVVSIDGRGTGYRSAEFRDAFLGTDDPLGAADQVAAITNMAQTHPYMDLDRVGVTGGSFGGYGSVRDMLLYPEFFKVGVAIAGPQDFSHMLQSVSSERFFGDPSASEDAREYYHQISNTRLADRLEGKLLLVYGAIDENVPFKHAMEIFDALIRAGKTFDTLILPDASHGVSMDPYVARRMLGYFAEHLGGPVPMDR